MTQTVKLDEDFIDNYFDGVRRSLLAYVCRIREFSPVLMELQICVTMHPDLWVKFRDDMPAYFIANTNVKVDDASVDGVMIHVDQAVSDGVLVFRCNRCVFCYTKIDRHLTGPCERCGLRYNDGILQSEWTVS